MVMVQDKAGAPRIGQDAVTSERFWEVISGYFAEDHKRSWMEKLLDIEVGDASSLSRDVL